VNYQARLFYNTWVGVWCRAFELVEEAFGMARYCLWTIWFGSIFTFFLEWDFSFWSKHL